jgi:FecR protein
VVARSIFKFVGLTVLVVGALTPALAQDPEDLRRGVARISLMDGEVTVRRGDSGEWVAGVINAPLMTDDRIATGQNSRAEIQFDAANVLRIGGNAEVHLALLESGRLHVEIYKGTVTFRMLRASSADIELNTPSVSARPAREGLKVPNGFITARR